jgi:branched-chain amino acid transport system substrate-binding protein
MTMRWFVAIVATLLLTRSASFASAADPLTIPAILPVTGSAAFLGKEFSETLALVENQVNKSGGIGGRPLHFAIQDTQSSPQVAVQLTNALLAGNPQLMINGAPLGVCAAVVPLVQNGPVMYCLSPSIRPEAGGYTYGVMASSRDCLIAAMNYYKSRGFKKIAILDGTDATGSDADTILADLIKLPDYAGMSYVANEHFNLADLSVAAQVARIKQSGAQAMIAYTTGTPIATVLHGMSDGGLDIPVLTSNGNMSVAQLDGYKAFVPKELLFSAYSAFTADPASDRGVQQKIDEFRADMKAANESPDLLHAIPWDPAFLIVEALKRAGPNATAQQIRDTLAGVQNWPGVLGRYDYRAIPNRGLGLKAMIVARWDPARSTWVDATKGNEATKVATRV